MKEYHKIRLESLCYFAGLLDGEGCVRIGRTKSQNNKYPYDYRGYIQIGMTNKEVLDWVSQNIGGTYYKGKNKSLKSKCSYNWFMNPIKGAEILKQILPYLIVKKKHAEVFIKYVSTMNGKPGKKGLPLEIVNKREIEYQHLKKLNKKGP